MPIYQTTELEVITIDPNQTGKAETHNDGMGQFAKCLANVYSKSLTAEVGSFTIPYSAAEGGDKTALHNIVMKFTGTPAGALDIVHPAVKHLFVVINESSQTITVKVSGQPGVAITSGTTVLCYCDGTDVDGLPLTAAGSVTIPYDPGFAYRNTPVSNEVIGVVEIARDILIPANMAGSVGSVDVNPTASFDIDVQDDGASIGTITINTSGVFSFVTAGGTSKTVLAGSRLEFIADSVADATIEGIACTILASVN